MKVGLEGMVVFDKVLVSEGSGVVRRGERS